MNISPGLLSSLQKLSLFQDLSPTQLKSLFKLCQQETYEPGEQLCRTGAESDRMFILLAGTVDIMANKNTVLVEESAVTTIGEAGMLTGAPRAASVIAKTQVTTLFIEKRPLMRLMQQDGSLAIRLFRNVLVVVRQKLIAADHKIEEMV